MKRDQLQALGLTEEQVESVMSMNGADITREKQRATDLQAQIDTLTSEAQTTAQRYATYDADMEELASLRAERDERGRKDRFHAVLGDRKPKNEYTANGLYADFCTAIADPANAERKDEEVFGDLIKDREQECFESRVSITMTPSADIPAIDPLREVQDRKYANNPFYKRS